MQQVFLPQKGIPAIALRKLINLHDYFFPFGIDFVNSKRNFPLPMNTVKHPFFMANIWTYNDKYKIDNILILFAISFIDLNPSIIV
jgi:hypothetical protein